MDTTEPSTVRSNANCSTSDERSVSGEDDGALQEIDMCGVEQVGGCIGARAIQYGWHHDAVVPVSRRDRRELVTRQPTGAIDDHGAGFARTELLDVRRIGCRHQHHLGVCIHNAVAVGQARQHSSIQSDGCTGRIDRNGAGRHDLSPTKRST